jgi:hypothetical protein
MTVPTTTGGRLLVIAAGLLLTITSMAVGAGRVTATPAVSASTASPTPGRPLILAHYYMWFDPTSWNRAKRDYPLAGRYSSDSPEVMHQQVAQAKRAGIGGFIVSWKSTPVLNARLHTLAGIARSENFKLAITYQGLTFDRMNLPAGRVGQDLDTFIADFAADPVFDIFGKPMVAITGTPGMTTDEVRSIAGTRRSALLILATEKNVQGYQRLADLVDGELYYWSSVNPATYRDFAAKLAGFGEAVRNHRSIWIAPAAPGFDARAVGGTSVVPRADGATLRSEWAAAETSLPAAIGLISWNEYSENTYLEPSRRYGTSYLTLVAALAGAAAPSPPDFDSSAPEGLNGAWRPVGVFGGVGALLLACTVVAVRRRRTLP